MDRRTLLHVAYSGLPTLVAPLKVMNIRIAILLAVLACGLAFIIRAPLINSDSVYLYQEDDAHHFNRTVEMYKSGDPNPHYFNKPSLHFYLRQPAVMAGVWAAKERGELSSSREVRTRDPYGLAGYAFTASHPTLVRWNRAFSVALSLGIVLMTFVVTFQLTGNNWYSFFSALAPAYSLEVVRNSHIVGVDILMALLCLLSTSCGIWAARSTSRKALFFSAIFAGLAASSKYNAAPAALVPFAAWLLTREYRHSVKLLTLIVSTVIGAFILGTPYALLTFFPFLDGVSYEIWHYGVAGHAEHSAGRGLPQVIFYSQWLLNEGTGVTIAFLAVLGTVALLCSKCPAKTTFLCFPLAYVALMVLQKTNFTRNMVVIVPYVAACAACGLQFVFLPIRSQVSRLLLGAFIGGVALVQQFLLSFAFVVARVSDYDSRDDLVNWLTSERPSPSDVAVAGQLQLPISTFKLSGVDAFDIRKKSPSALFNDGFTYVVVPSTLLDLSPAASGMTTILSLPGSNEQQRIPKNPAVTVLSGNESQIAALSKEWHEHLTLSFDTPGTLGCESPKEGHCWISHLVTTLYLESTNEHSPFSTRTVMMMTPWQSQRVRLRKEGIEAPLFESTLEPGTWIPVSLPSDTNSAELTITEVHSPASRGVSRDPRRLGVAIRAATP
jgi:hypothetical protein